MDFIGPFTDGLRALANAEGRCVKDNTALLLAGAVAGPLNRAPSALTSALKAGGALRWTTT